MTDRVTDSAAGDDRGSLAARLLGALALVAGLAGAGLVGLGTRAGISGGILLLIAAVGLAAIAIGGRPFGPVVEGPLDLSARIGLGLLGGFLAGLLHALLTQLSGDVGLIRLLGVGIDAQLGATEWWLRAAKGSLWGVGLGVFYPLVPGAGFVRKGAYFSLVPSLYTLLVVYPAFLGFGILGVRLGVLTFSVVVIGNAAAGVLAAWAVSWGERTDEAPVSAPLVG